MLYGNSAVDMAIAWSALGRDLSDGTHWIATLCSQ